MKLKIIVLMTIALGEFLSVTSQDCPAFGRVKFGRVKYRSRRKIARFKCRRKYTLLGAKLSICLRGAWNNPAPVCIAPGCDIPDPTLNLIMTTSKNDALLTLDCHMGYQLQGPGSIYCDGRQWSSPFSTCVYIAPELRCDFEDDKMCGWTQYKGDDFDWTYNRHGTNTADTGPDADHTLGIGENGRYLYMESSLPRSEGDNATILSPPYKDLPNGTCFEFYYHMKGKAGPNQVGSLLVSVRRGEEDIDKIVPSFNVSGHKGPDWLRGSFEIGDVISMIQIVITGVRGKSYTGDIAIDDVRLYNCSDDVADVTTESELDTTVQWTTNIPEMTSLEIDDVSTQFATTTVQDEVTTTSELITSDGNFITTSSQPDVTFSTSVWNTTAAMSATTPDVFGTTEESLTTAEITKEMTSKPTTSVLSTSKMTQTPTTEMVTTTSTTTTATPTTTRRPSTSTTSVTTTPTTTTRTTTTTPITTTTTKPTTTMTTTTTTKKPTSTTTRATTPKQTTTPIISTTSQRKSTTPSTTAATTTAKTTTTKATTSKSSTTSTAPTTYSSVPLNATTTSTASVSTTATSTARASTTTLPGVTGPTQTNNETDIPNVIGDKTHPSKSPLKPLMIGIGVGVAIGLAIVLVIVFLYMKKHRKKDDDMEDEMAPIARNAYSEW